MKLSELFLEQIQQEVPVGHIGLYVEIDSNGKRELNRKIQFEYNTKDGEEIIYGTVEVLRPNTRDEAYRLDPNSNFDEKYDREIEQAEETIANNADKIFKLKDKQSIVLKVI